MLIALGVTGGIGAYKAVEVARGLQKRGHEVVAVMTHSATRFVGAVTFEAITRHRVITDQFEPGANADIHASTVNGHISTDFPLTVRGRMVVGKSLQGTIGSGGHELKLNTVNGSIHLRQGASI